MRFSPRELDPSVQLLRSVVGRIQAKPGCRACSVARNVAEDCLVHYSETWDSEAAFERHVKSEEFRRVLVAMDMCSDEPYVIVGNLSGRIGIGYLRELREKQGNGVKSKTPLQKHSAMREATSADLIKGDKDAATKIPQDQAEPALELIDKLKGHFKPKEFKDTYSGWLEEVIHIK